MSDGHYHVLDSIGEAGGERIRLTTHDDDNTCRITCMMRGEQHVAEADDFFEALCLLRQRFLEPMGLIPRCYGASLDVWPSAMARQMGRGLAAYRVEIGEPGGELVDIFATGDDVEPVTVAAQQRFAERWRASLRG